MKRQNNDFSLTVLKLQMENPSWNYRAKQLGEVLLRIDIFVLLLMEANIYDRWWINNFCDQTLDLKIKTNWGGAAK